MGTPPRLEAGRLVLRPFGPDDADDVARLAGALEIASTTLHIPHPYTREMAAGWIAGHGAQFDAGAAAVFAMTLRASGTLIGAVGLTIDGDHRRAEVGYWVGTAWWGRGFGTEAVGAVLRYAFEDLDLHRVHAVHFTRNPASGRIMQKVGMTYEGTLRQHILKWDTFEDVALYGILREDWRRARAAANAAAPR